MVEAFSTTSNPLNYSYRDNTSYTLLFNYSKYLLSILFFSKIFISYNALLLFVDPGKRNLLFFLVYRAIDKCLTVTVKLFLYTIK